MDPIIGGALISAGGGLLSGLLGSKNKSTQSNTPWKPQGDQLKYLYGEAQDQYKQGPAEYYQGEQVAGLNQEQLAALQGLQAQSQTGGEYAQQLGQYGQQQMGYGGQAGDLATQAGGMQYGQITPESSALSMDRVSEIYNNPLIQGQIQAANRDTQRNLLEQQLPGLRANAAATGNIGSARSAVSQGIAERGAMDRMADTSAQIMGRAYEQGLGVAGQEASQDATMRAAAQTANVQNAFNQANTQLQAASQLGNMGGQGASALQNAAGMGTTAAMTGLTGSEYMQQQAQRELAPGMAQWQYETNAPQQALQSYAGIVQGGGNMGGTQTNITPGFTPGQAVNVGAQLGSAYMMNRQPNQTYTPQYTPQGQQFQPQQPYSTDMTATQNMYNQTFGG